MKYILKRALPFANIGAIVDVKEGQPITFDNGFGFTYTCDYGLIDKLLNDGWIEEVKPREYKLGLNKDGTFAYIWDSEGRGYDAQRQYPTAETIKVREVIE